MGQRRRITLLIICLIGIVTVIILAGCDKDRAPESYPLQEARTLLDSAIQAHLAGDNAGAIDLLKEARGKRPNHPRTLSVLGQLEALDGRTDDALATLAALADLGVTSPISANENYVSLRQEPKFQTLAERFKAADGARGDASLISTLPEKIALVESVALDVASGDLFVSSIVERRIMRLSSDGGLEEFASAASHGLWSVTGLKIEDETHTLWAATAATEFTPGLVDNELGASGVFAFDIGSGELIHKFILQDGDTHWFGDLVLTSNGNLFVSDSMTPTLYFVDVEQGEILPFVSNRNFASLQGLDMSKDGTTLFLADYATGLFKVDLISKHVSPLVPGPGVVPYGVDGLYVHESDLIAVQNGTAPQRVVRISLNERTSRLTSSEVLVQNHVAHLEPTLGQIDVNRFIYVANSGWPLYGPGKTPPLQDIPATKILEVDLSPKD